MVAYDSSSETLFWISENNNNLTLSDDTVKNVSLDGTINYTWTPTDAAGEEKYFTSIACDASNVFIVGYKDYNTYGRGIIYKTNHDFSSVSTSTPVKTGLGSYYQATSVCLNSTHALITIDDFTSTQGCVIKVDKSNISSYTTSNIFTNRGRAAYSCTEDRILIPTDNGAYRQILMFKISDLSLLFTQNLDTKVADAFQVTSSNKSNFYVSYRNASDTAITINTISNSDTYNLIDTYDIPLSSGLFSRRCTLNFENDSLIASGTIDGKLESDSTDAGGSDCFFTVVAAGVPQALKDNDPAEIFHNAATGYAVPIGYADMVAAYDAGALPTYAFQDVTVPYQYKNLLIYKQGYEPTGSNSIKLAKFIGQQDNIVIDVDGDPSMDINNQVIFTEE